jgi:hypothetical protein
MKNKFILLFGFLIFSVSPLFSQNRSFITDIDREENINKEKLDTLKNLLIKEINFPLKASLLNETGCISGDFIVNENGKLVGIIFTESNINYDFDKEIIKVFNKIKKKITFINNTNELIYYEFRFNFFIEGSTLNEN